ncbi:MAG: prolyl oligopeptidase family serine peptidase, partial [Candidatus Eiseniibacteriota bacterium]
MSRSSSLAPAVAAAAVLALVGPAHAAQRPLVETDLYRFVWVADPQISPDGSRVAFVRVTTDSSADEYRTAIWVVEAGGGAPRPLTTGPRDGQPRWSPDGRTLAFVRAPEDKPGQIQLLPMTGGEPTQLTRLKGGASAPAWSPDGRRIAFSSRTNPALDDDTTRAKPKKEPGRVITRPVFRLNNAGFFDLDHPLHVWVVDAAGGKARQLTTGRFGEGAPAWSRDGRWICFTSDRRKEPWFGGADDNLYVVPPDLAKPTDGAGLRTRVDYDGGIGDWVEAADGRIAFVGGTNPAEVHSYDQDDLMIAEASGAPVRALTGQYDFDIGAGISADQHAPRGGGRRPLAFAADGRSVLAVIAREGSAMLARLDAASGAVEELTPAGREVIAGTSTPDGRTWALTIGDAANPGDLFLFDAVTRQLRKLFGPNDALLREAALGRIEEFWYRSFDGRRIQGWIMKPPDLTPTRKYPLVLAIHGGPHAAYGAAFMHEFHMLAGAGYVVLFTNPRGSTTYGQEFGNIIQHRYPGDDHRDLMAGVDEVLRRGYVDPKRMAVCGGSGGGLLTNWAITHTDRFAAAITDRCVSEWISFYYNADFTLFRPSWFKKPPFEDPQESIERSPVTYASRITTPLMIIHSEEDWRTPIGQGEAMFRALKQQRKPAVMVRFPGENHELSRSGTPSRRVQRLQHYHKWFDKWLMGRPIKD